MHSKERAIWIGITCLHLLLSIVLAIVVFMPSSKLSELEVYDGNRRIFFVGTDTNGNAGLRLWANDGTSVILSAADSGNTILIEGKNGNARLQMGTSSEGTAKYHIWASDFGSLVSLGYTPRGFEDTPVSIWGLDIHSGRSDRPLVPSLMMGVTGQETSAEGWAEPYFLFGGRNGEMLVQMPKDHPLMK